MNPGFIDHKQPKLTKEKLSFKIPRPTQSGMLINQLKLNIP